jgi:predicted metal-binding membrane protein
MFGVGAGSLAWMAALAGVMVVEKTIPGGRWLSPVVGSALMLLAVVWTIHRSSWLAMAWTVALLATFTYRI